MPRIIHHHELSHTPSPGAVNILHGLHGLWAARVISQDAFFLGAQVCQQMHAGKISQVLYTGDLACTRYTTLSGTVYTGSISKSLQLYVTALQDLHSHAGLHSYLHEPKNEAEMLLPHFTLSPELIAGQDYTLSTPLYFRVTIEPKTEFFEHINKLAAAKLMKCSSLQITEE